MKGTNDSKRMTQAGVFSDYKLNMNRLLNVEAVAYCDTISTNRVLPQLGALV